MIYNDCALRSTKIIFIYRFSNLEIASIDVTYIYVHDRRNVILIMKAETSFYC